MVNPRFHRIAIAAGNLSSWLGPGVQTLDCCPLVRHHQGLLSASLSLSHAIQLLAPAFDPVPYTRPFSFKWIGRKGLSLTG